MWNSIFTLIEWFCNVPTWRRQFGGWWAAGAAAIGAVGSYMTSQNASNAAGQSFQSQQQIAQQEQGLSNQQNAEATQLYNRYRTLFQPVQDQYLKMLTTPVDANTQAGLAAGDVNEAAKGQQAALQRQEQSYGLNPNSGRAMALNKEGSLATSAAAAGAATSARRWAQNTNLQRMGIGAQMGDTQLNEAAGLQSASLSGLSGAGAIYGQQGSTYANAAMGAGASAGQFLGMAGYYAGGGGRYYGSPGTPNTLNTDPNLGAGLNSLTINTPQQIGAAPTG